MMEDESHGNGISICRIEDSRHVQLTGELDMEAVDRMPPAELVAAEGNVQDLVLDLSRLAYIDSSGLRWILKIQRAAVAKGITMTIYVREASVVLRTLNLIGAGCLFPIDILPIE